jgi:hypothetical protein
MKFLALVLAAKLNNESPDPCGYGHQKVIVVHDKRASTDCSESTISTR